MTLLTSGDKGISAFPESDSLFRWVGTIHGAAGTVHEDLRYKLSLEFPSGSLTSPTVKFLTPCYHPSVDTQGNICLDILKDKWSALYDVRTILLSIQSLLGEPNIDSPLNTHAAELWKNPTAFKKYLQETYSKQVSSQDHSCKLSTPLLCRLFSETICPFSLISKLCCYFCFEIKSA